MPIKPKPIKRWGQPHKIIEKTPEISKRSAYFIKSREHIEDISKVRESDSVVPDLKKYEAFERQHSGKPILTISTNNPNVKQLPNQSNIASFFMDFYSKNMHRTRKTIYDPVTQEDMKYAKTEVMSILNKNGKEIGRVHIRLSLTAVNILKEYYLMMSLGTKGEIENKIRWDIVQLTEKEITKRSSGNRELTDEQKNFIYLQTIKHYYEDVLKLHIHFNPMPGYKYNEKKLMFEKVNK